ncbi:bile acid:sodium symporter family protein [Shewanella surugensis]|uniref:Bile acid:sodium symporter family protein n=1 Tax=Shewanella surugensis TaxID=212020 RepID=A0ABT0LDK8_9GAMM|nr:bile acid:sodium symporter family protein [Shewanella surugensis]MCL1125750.1 bile acid:sodium symporter family protein [Shewanella surugensis]
MSVILTRLFPLWVLLMVGTAFAEPAFFIDFKGMITPLLALIMLCMGLTLTAHDFSLVMQKKRVVFLGVLLQFTLMPLLALFIAKSLQLNDDLLVGMVLLGSVAGGTASNVMCFLAKGNVALSITMTATSTLLSVVLTPILVELLVGKVVDVPFLSMLLSMVKIVLFPVGIGLLLNTFLTRVVSRIGDWLPFLSMVVIAFIIAIVVALNVSNIASMGLLVMLAVILHNGFGLLSGYWGARFFGYDEAICRTIAIEVGMQNSGLAVALSMQFFNAITALPGAIFSVWHVLSGSVLASFWFNRKVSRDDPRA